MKALQRPNPKATFFRNGLRFVILGLVFASASAGRGVADDAKPSPPDRTEAASEPGAVPGEGHQAEAAPHVTPFDSDTKLPDDPAAMRLMIGTEKIAQWRRRAVLGFARAGDRRALNAVRFLLHREKNPQVIAACIQYLGLLGCAEDHPAVVRATSYDLDPKAILASETEVHVEALLALGRLGAVADVDKVEQFPANGELEKRAKSAALEALGTGPAIELGAGYRNWGGHVEEDQLGERADLEGMPACTPAKK